VTFTFRYSRLLFLTRMPYQKLSEYQAKSLYYSHVDHSRNEQRSQEKIFIDHCNIDTVDKLSTLPEKNTYVIKIDDGSKRRMKRGLVKINQTPSEMINWVKSRPEYRSEYVIEESVKVHSEIYVMFRLTESGTQIVVNYTGGVNLDDPETDGVLVTIPPDEEDVSSYLVGEIDDVFDLHETIQRLYEVYRKYHYVFLEVNPIGVIEDDNGPCVCRPLDFAVLRDSCSNYLIDKEDLEIIEMSYLPESSVSECEENIKKLDARTGGSLKFTLLNPNGDIWTLIAGGGASVVYTDAVINSGNGHRLANYGEYSGDPQEDLVYEYCMNVFSQMIKVNGPKILFIGGGIANFTDVAVTFNGVIRAIRDISNTNPEFCTDVTVWCRRGGPNYKQALTNLKTLFEKLMIKHFVSGPNEPITECVSRALKRTDGNKVDELTDYYIKPADLKKVDKLLDTVLQNKNKDSFNQSTKEFDTTSILNSDTKAILIGLNRSAVQRMLDFDYTSGRVSPSIVAVVDSVQTRNVINEQFFFGNDSILIPVYKKYEECTRNHAFDVAINFTSFRTAYISSMEVMEKTSIKMLVIIAEGVPEHLTVSLNFQAKKKGVKLIGPATVGGVKAGEFRIGNTCGSLENVRECNIDSNKGDVAFVTRSGGLLNELCWIVGHNTDGVYQGISIGGDRWPGSQFIDYVLEYDRDPRVNLIVLLGEVGGVQELLVSLAKKRGIIKKPVIGWCMGTSADFLKEVKGDTVQFGHAGASSTTEYESATFKNKFMRESGIHVPKTFEDLTDTIVKVYSDVKRELNNRSNNTDQPIDRSINKRRDIKPNRKAPVFYSSISNEMGDELTYNKVKVSEICASNHSLGKTIGHLWLKTEVPDWLANYFELILTLTADHGGMVSGAHNTMVASRAGKDLISSLCSGLLTIGDTFGGALNKSAQQFYKACHQDAVSPAEFVNRTKAQGELISGIGHKIKTLENPDSRVALLKKYVRENFSYTKTVDYALEVEKITTQKRNNLILNVDGFVAVSLIDAFLSVLPLSEVEAIIERELINGFFVLGRTIGFIGHWHDQKRLKQGLFRLPESDIQYV
ncbi:hypothetical protein YASMINEVIRUS_1274, partial [Yasminevirus sp. GU-2018]